MDFASTVEDLFDNEADGGDEVSQLPQLADIGDTPNPNDESNLNDSTADLPQLRAMTGAAKKIRKPIPKLDTERLMGERGVSLLPDICKKMKFKGKGHEDEDLHSIMRELQLWAHRMYPKASLDHVLEKCEALGRKRMTAIHMKRIRLDMPLLHLPQQLDAEENQQQQPSDAEENQQQPSHDVSEIPADVDEWSEAMRDLEDNVRSDAEPETVGSTASQPSVSLSEEQKSKIEENKLKAMQRRQQVAKAKNKDLEDDSVSKPTAADETVSLARAVTSLSSDHAGIRQESMDATDACKPNEDETVESDACKPNECETMDATDACKPNESETMGATDVCKPNEDETIESGDVMISTTDVRGKSVERIERSQNSQENQHLSVNIEPNPSLSAEQNSKDDLNNSKHSGQSQMSKASEVNVDESSQSSQGNPTEPSTAE